MTSASSDLLLEARGIVKRYGGNVALDQVTYRIRRNQVNVLIGENGAGKSTLMRILAGAEIADKGELLLDGEPISIRSPREAAAHGISIVHQELAVLPNLDVSENIFAGRELTRASSIIDRATQDRRSAAAMEKLRKPVPVRSEAAHLSLGCRQLLEIARSLVFGAKLLILDEPTSALSTSETESLFEVLAELRQSGVTIIYISHRLHELLYLGDWFTVLRSGRVVGEAPRNEVSREWIVERMSGRPAAPETEHSRAERTNAAPLLRAEGLTLESSGGDQEAQAPLHSVSFALAPGEVLGIYGLLGAGRTELVEALAGHRRMAAGRVYLRDTIVELRNVTDTVAAGIVLVPEDRQRDGLFSELSVRENIAIAATKGIFLSRTQETARVQEIARELNIVPTDCELPVSLLSGGNQQKVLLARCLMRSPSVLLLDEPTRGVDVGARQEIYRTLRRLAANGLSILFTSSEIEETRLLADRVLVLCQGRISARFLRNEITDEALFAAASPSVSRPERGNALAHTPSWSQG
ncbi:ribose import ATP-binding protein RbsA [Edaphobacter acidisoli]|uniref:Ribose import ATP-binding protein RbsA n=1 Tax=Edaphobacter acidisoli TaxID=2040573 RepID=A0A916RDM9_9BACT|nr:sugar ABC transporter ATP-binding protein [Edaphobacter acidisoli]GGA53479.1 ribose import ATP-binding protein RbsA [Edaphobacter acidisoli]